MVGIVEMVNIVIHVVLKSAKDRILGIDTTRQHVPPRVWYGMASLLIRNVICCVPCPVEWGLASYIVTYFVKRLNHMVQEGPFVGETLALQAGPFVGESIAKYCILL
jgi:hypothetical protein